MEITVNKQFDEIFETICLIHSTYHPEEWGKEKFLEKCSEHGINGEKIYHKVNPIDEQYTSVFQAHMVKSEDDLFFFGDIENEWFATLISIMIKNRHWLNDIEKLDEHLIYDAVALEVFDEIPENIQSIIHQLQSEKYAPNVCWKWTLVFENPQKYMSKLVQILNRNIPAYHRALSEVKSLIEPLLSEFKEPPLTYFEKVAPAIGRDFNISPTLVSSIGANAFFGGIIYVGLFFNEIYQLIERKDKPKENVIHALKLLGDQSKFEILYSLIPAPKYNLEIAKQMGITSATASHHMNILLNHEFVSLEKRNGKVYYSLRTERIQEIISDLEAVFL